LKRVTLAHRPEYHAISYAWGETAGEDGPPKEETMLLDEKEFNISTNLASALRHFRGSYPNKLLWADAISHNQDDDDEMNAQVGMMREIYKECEEVHVWLGKESPLKHPAARIPPAENAPCSDWSLATGPSYEETEEDKEKVNQYNNQFREFYNLPTALQHNRAQDFRMGSFCLLHALARGEHLNHRDFHFLQQISSRDGVLEALAEMMQRSWWSRQWVIQETILDKVAIVHYGRFKIPWNMFTKAMVTIDNHYENTCCSAEYAKLRSSDLRCLLEFADTVRDIDHWRTVWLRQENAPIRLLPLLWQFRQRDTGRLHDKIYALLPLVKDWGNEAPIQVHYDWDEAHVYTDLTQQLVDVHDSLLPIMGTTRKSPKLAHLPSWVPDWSVKPDMYEVARLDRSLLYYACGFQQDERGDPIQSQSGGAKLKFATKSNVRFYETPAGDSYHFLELRGVLFDKVSHMVGSLMPQDDDAAIRNTFGEWTRIAVLDNTEDEPYGPSQHSKADAYWRTICMNTIKVSDEDNLPLYKRQYELAPENYGSEYVKQIGNLDGPTSSDHAIENGSGSGTQHAKKRQTWSTPHSPHVSIHDGLGPANLRHGLLTRRSGTARSEEAEEDEIVKINQAIKSATTDRKFFLTTKGYMGLGPKELKEGDEVAVLVGGHTPFVLRGAGEQNIGEEIGEKQCYTLIGDCYVHGIMEGQAFEDIKAIHQTERLYLC
jgi:hypothetical protein